MGFESHNTNAQIEKSAKPLGVALIGAGMVAGTHLQAIIHANSSVSLCGVLARRTASAIKLLKDLPKDYQTTPRIYQTVEQIAQDDSVDIAIIATPPNIREALIKPLVNAGKHILLEKPIARNLAESKAVVELCEQAKVSLGIVFQHRFREASIAAKRIIETGSLGKLGVVEAKVPYWRDQSYYDELGRGTYERDGGGVLISQAIHTIDLMLSLAGPVSHVQAMASTSMFHNMEAEDFVSAGFQFKNGAIGSLTASSCSFPGSAESITLHFEKASLRLEAGVLDVHWRNGTIEQHGAQAGTGGGADPMAFTHEWHQSVIEDFANAICDNSTPLIQGREALLAHQLIHAIEQSEKQSQKIEV